ncbi:hypothetical protein AOL_s00112g53 [Orbilia oligospora ATCC 24927]|uniref:RHO1 GDP-GTP exchange protein 2 n=2 Tax=Orbilia oligospora TaxID=2813651 RepID=G1XLM3_ARTOA|nr:hypothetical protein AOL_s00112g53 [Orbilia oligospora ATCC 24927]EGX45975.1 hypothetical protein AOL_s00112g53 [Orbilia oligospora ATCC 24927]KAF3274381.1 hypothetical protein TWF970_007899 [Orbilia oligospora]
MANLQPQGGGPDPRFRARSPSFGSGDDRYFDGSGGLQQRNGEDFYNPNFYDRRNEGAASPPAASAYGAPPSNMALSQQSQYVPTPPAHSSGYQPMYYPQNSTTLPTQPNIPPPPPRQPYGATGLPGNLQAGSSRPLPGLPTGLPSHPKVGYNPGNHLGRTMSIVTTTSPTQYQQYVPQSPTVNAPSYASAFANSQYGASGANRPYNPALYGSNVPPPPPPPPQRHGTVSGGYYQHQQQHQLPQPPPPPPLLQNQQTYSTYSNSTTGAPAYQQLHYHQATQQQHQQPADQYTNGEQGNWDYEDKDQGDYKASPGQRYGSTSSQGPQSPNYYDNQSTPPSHHYQSYHNEGGEYSNPLPTPPPPPKSHSPHVDSQYGGSNGQRLNRPQYSTGNEDSLPSLPSHGPSDTTDRQKMEEDAREALYADIENLVSGTGPPSGRSQAPPSASQFSPDVDLLFQRAGAQHPGNTDEGGLPYPTYAPGGNSSDEAAAAWEAMRADEYRETQDKITNGHVATLPPDQDQEPLSEVLDMPMDLSGFSGMGFYDRYDDEPSFPSFKPAGQDNVAPVLPSHKGSTDLGRSDTMNTVNTVTTLNTVTTSGDLNRRDTTSTTATGNSTLYGDYVYPNPEFDDGLHPFAPFSSAAARVDTFGTGGLANPERRNSFQEGDEYEGFATGPVKTVITADESDEDDVYPGFMEPSFYPTPSYELNRTKSDSNAAGEGYLPVNPDARLKSSLSLNYPHTSTSSLGPARSKTDASAPLKPAGARPPVSRPAANRAAVAQSQIFDETALGAIDLPSIKTRKFDPEKLSSKDFKKCEEAWAISQIFAWLQTITEGEEFLKEKGIAEAIVALFTHKVPTMNVADAETLATRVLKTLWENDCLVRDEEWVKWNADREVSGVIFQISGRGCYAPRLHADDSEELPDTPGRCYSHLCARTLKKISLSAHPEDREKKKEDWATFWQLKATDVEGVNKKEVERQNNLHEVVQTEQEYLDHMRVLRVVYHDQLQIVQKQSQVIKPKNFDQFMKDVFGKAEAVRKSNEDHLLPQLKFRQREQGPWIVGFSDIFREWIRRAKPAYIEYAAAFPWADAVLRHESEKNILFRRFLEECRQDPRASRLEWQHFLKNPITRLQRYGLLLQTILKHSLKEGDEKVSLQAAIDEIKAVTLECDARVDEMTKRVTLADLGRKLVMRPGMVVDLRLEEKGREVIYQGDLQRTGNRFTWLETHAILFDHYLVLAKTVTRKDVAAGPGKNKHEKYDVSRMPIPMDLLVIEDSVNDAPVVKSSVKIIGPATKQVHAGPGQRPSIPNSSTPGPNNLTHTQTSTSIGSVNSPAWDAKDKDNVMYPFRIRHLGKAYKGEDNTYTLYAPSAAARADWVEKIILAKERHAASLFRQNAEPFRIRIMSDSAFGYEAVSGAASPKDVNIRGTPLDRAIKEAESLYSGPKPAVLTRAQVNCATTFHTGMGYGKQMVAIGTDAGVYISDYENPRGWTKAINSIARVTQIAVLEDFSLFLVLADRTLIAYHLDVVVPPAGGVPVSESAKRAPQKLSGGKDVGFFATSRMKDRMLVFYKRKDGLSSTFKVLEPVFHKATERKSRFSRRGTTEFFREFDEFYIPTECYGISLFHSSLSIHSSKGFEVMTLDKKQPWSIPELKAPHVQAIALRVGNQRPLGMFRLSDIEFLLCYEECGVYVNKHGDVSRSVIMEFVGKAKASAHYPPYVLLFDQDFVEIRNADNGRLRQVIAGRDARCLDDGQGGGSAGQRTIKLAMVHPEIDTRQVVVELQLNEGQKD